jgi:hypothetical protein
MAADDGMVPRSSIPAVSGPDDAPWPALGRPGLDWLVVRDYLFGTRDAIEDYPLSRDSHIEVADPQFSLIGWEMAMI